jgi:hypothetical protein
VNECKPLPAGGDASRTLSTEARMLKKMFMKLRD